MANNLGEDFKKVIKDGHTASFPSIRLFYCCLHKKPDARKLKTARNTCNVNTFLLFLYDSLHRKFLFGDGLVQLHIKIELRAVDSENRSGIFN